MSDSLNPQWEAGREAGYSQGYDKGFDDGFSDGAGETDATLLQLIDDLWAFIQGPADATAERQATRRALEARVRETGHTA